MEYLQDIIKKGTTLTIFGENYEVLSKTRYFSRGARDEFYYKISLSQGKVLIVFENATIIYFGEKIDIKDSVDFDGADKITFQNEEFKKAADDYQFVDRIEFGDSKNSEPECRFIDYETEDKLLSLGLISYSNERSDVLMAKIDLKTDLTFFAS
jgi:hypothetical protein